MNVLQDFGFGDSELLFIRHSLKLVSTVKAEDTDFIAVGTGILTAQLYQ